MANHKVEHLYLKKTIFETRWSPIDGRKRDELG